MDLEYYYFDHIKLIQEDIIYDFLEQYYYNKILTNQDTLIINILKQENWNILIQQNQILFYKYDEQFEKYILDKTNNYKMRLINFILQRIDFPDPVIFERFELCFNKFKYCFIEPKNTDEDQFNTIIYLFKNLIVDFDFDLFLHEKSEEYLKKYVADNFEPFKIPKVPFNVIDEYLHKYLRINERFIIFNKLLEEFKVEFGLTDQDLSL